MRPLAVLVTPQPGARGGGVERFTGLLSDLLDAHGWRVEEVGPAATGGHAARRLGLAPLLATRSATRGIGRLRPALVVSNGTLGAGAPRGVPRVHVLHGTMVRHVLDGEAAGLPRREVVRRVVSNGLAEAAAARSATATVAVSGRAAAEARRYYRVRVDAVVENAVDLDVFRPLDRAEARSRLGLPADGRLALFVGRLEDRKGAPLLAPACERAGWQLVVAGTGAGPGLRLGQLGSEELPWAYAAGDALLFPTRYEGFPYVALEALACGRPVVTTAAGWGESLARLLPSFDPYVVAPDVDALAGALRRLAAAPDAADLGAEAAAAMRPAYGLPIWREHWADVLRAAAPAAWP